MTSRLCLLLLLLLLLLLEPLPGVRHLMTQDDISLFLVLLVESQIEIQIQNSGQLIGSHAWGIVLTQLKILVLTM